MIPNASDQSLVDGLRAGRRDAFEQLYADYHGPIYNLCARIVGDREEAKDLTQDVFIKAFGQLPQSEELKLRPWLYRVATNACFNHLRSRRKLDSGAAGLEETPAAVDEFERAQAVTYVEQSLGQLNERYRTALVLKDLQGLPAEEIAEVMEVSRPAADVLVHRARASFKTAFAKLAGQKIPAPASLGLVLAPLSVPAALHMMPPLPASLTPMHPLPHLDISQAVGPAGTGLIAKITAAVTAKVAITAAAALIVGGGVVAVHEVERSEASHPSSVAHVAAVFSPALTGIARDGHDGGHDSLLGHHGTHHHSDAMGHDAGDHSGDGTQHDSTEHATTSSGTHDGGMTSTSGTIGDHSTTTTAIHDSGTTTHEGDHASGE